MQTTNTYKCILAVTGLFTLVMGVLLFIHPPALYPDPSWGFQVMRNMQMGGGFNMLPYINADNLAKNDPAFLTWWSPGQYLLPYFFILLLKLSIGHATAITITLCSFLGLWGWYKLFNKLGFSPMIASVSIAFIACQQAYMVPYVFYNGGEILLFAFAGWFLYSCTCFTRAGWLMACFVLLSGIAGFFCKSSFLWIFFAGALYLWIKLSQGKIIRNWIINGLYIAIPAVCALAVIYITYLSKGLNPSSGALGIKLQWETFTFPLAAPVLSGFSADDLTNGLIYPTGTPLFSATWAIIILFIFALISVSLFVMIIRSAAAHNYKLLIAVFYGVALLFFGISFLRQATISYEARHMRIIGLIFIPGIIYLLTKAKFAYRLAFGIFWIFMSYCGLKFLYKGYRYNAYETAHGATGIAQPFIDQQAFNYITALDQQQSNALFIFVSADIGLEIQHNRIITFNPVNDQLYADNISTYYGHAGPLYLVLPNSFKGAKANFYFNCFPGYHNFTLRQISKNYVLYQAN